MKNLILRFVLLLAVLFPSLASAADGDFRGAILSVGTNFVQNGAQTTFTLGGATNPQNDWLEQAFLVTEAATITKLCYSYGARTGTPPTYKIGLETVSATTGKATGYKTGSGECSATFTPPASTADDGHIVCKTLTGTACTVARGDVVAWTIKYSAGTVNTTNNSSFLIHFANGQSNYSNQNYLWKVTNSVYTLDAGYENTAVFMGDASGRYWGNPAVSYSQASYTGTNEKALRFQVLCPAGQTFKLDGVEPFFSAPAAGDTIVVSLYDSTSTAISGATVTIDTDQIGNPSGNVSMRATFGTLPTLTCRTTYYAGVKWGSANTFLHTTQVDNNAYFDAWPLGIQTYGAHRTSSGVAFVDDTTERPHINLILNTMVSAGGSGGVKTDPGLNGGMNN